MGFAPTPAAGINVRRRVGAAHAVLRAPVRVGFAHPTTLKPARPCSVVAPLAVVRLLLDVPAGVIELALQVGEFPARQYAVRAIGFFLVANALLFLPQTARFERRQGARAQSLRDLLLLPVLKGIDAAAQVYLLIRIDVATRAETLAMTCVVEVRGVCG